MLFLLLNLCSRSGFEVIKVSLVDFTFIQCDPVTKYQLPCAHDLCFCFVDFACSAPYIDIDMHPKNPKQKLDAIYFSPHKFLGGPGATGVLIFDQDLYTNKVPDNPGGGTVDWTNPWGDHR